MSRPPLTRLAATALLVLVAALPALAVPVNEDTVREIGTELRCVVCQNLSVADSPSETANQMRAIIRERLAAGETPEQVKAYFVEKYGLWILLSPPKQGFNLLVWIVPFVGLGLGLVLVAFTVRRRSRRPPALPAGTPEMDAATRDRNHREMTDMDRSRADPPGHPDRTPRCLLQALWPLFRRN